MEEKELTEEFKVLKEIADRMAGVGLLDYDCLVDENCVEVLAKTLAVIAKTFNLPDNMLDALMSESPLKIHTETMNKINTTFLGDLYNKGDYAASVLSQDLKDLVKDLPEDFWDNLAFITKTEKEVLKKNFNKNNKTLVKMISGLMSTLVIDQMPYTLYPSGLHTVGEGDDEYPMEFVRDLRGIEEWWRGDDNLKSLTDDSGVVREIMYVIDSDRKDILGDLDWHVKNITVQEVHRLIPNNCVSAEVKFSPYRKELVNLYRMMYLFMKLQRLGKEDDVILKYFYDTYIIRTVSEDKGVYLTTTALDRDEGVAIFNFYASVVPVTLSCGSVHHDIVWYLSGDPVSKSQVTKVLSGFGKVQADASLIVEEFERIVLLNYHCTDTFLVMTRFNRNVPLLVKINLDETGQMVSNIKPHDLCKVMVF